MLVLYLTFFGSKIIFVELRILGYTKPKENIIRYRWWACNNNCVTPVLSIKTVKYNHRANTIVNYKVQANSKGKPQDVSARTEHTYRINGLKTNYDNLNCLNIILYLLCALKKIIVLLLHDTIVCKMEHNAHVCIWVSDRSNQKIDIYLFACNIAYNTSWCFIVYKNKNYIICYYSNRVITIMQVYDISLQILNRKRKIRICEISNFYASTDICIRHSN